MSVGFRVASERVTFCSVRMLTICAATESSEPISLASSSGEPTLTAITMSGLQLLRTSSIGTLSTRPPSTRSVPPSSTGAIRPGTDMLARIALVRLPLRNTTLSPLTRSVATMAVGKFSCSICGSPYSLRTSLLKKSLIFWPPTTPGNRFAPLSLTPTSDPGR